jgi:ABC-type transport system substrate-binding protein
VQGGDSQTMTGLSGYGGGFQVSLTSPDCEFALRLGDPGLAPVPADAGAHDNAAYNDSPIGNGPFKLERYVKDQKVTLVRNDAWAFGKTKLDRVTIDLSADPTRTGTAGFKGNEYDWVPLDSQNLGAAKGEAEMAKRTLQGLTYLVPITARGPMKSKDARLAVSYALDRQALSNLVYGGVNPPATGIVPSSIRGFGSRGACPSCGGTDPERAKQHAVRAGLGSGTTIPLYTRNTPSQQRSAELVRDQLQRNLGWKVELKGTAAADFGAFTKEITSSGAEGLATFSWLPDYPSARAILHPLLGGDHVATPTNGRLNLSGWRNARFGQLMSETAREPDEATRRRHLNEAERIALNDLAIIPVTFTGTAVLRGDEFTGLQLDIDGHPTLAEAALK